MNTDKKRGFHAVLKAHRLVTGGKPARNVIPILLHPCLSVSIRGKIDL